MTAKLGFKLFSVVALIFLVFLALGLRRGNHDRGLAGNSTTSSAILCSHGYFCSLGRDRS